MSDFIVRIAETGENTDLYPVGMAIDALSSAKQAIKDAGGTIMSSGNLAASWDSWPKEMQDHIEKIYDSMAVSVYGDGADPVDVGPGAGDQMKTHMTLKFVFEEEGEMVVPIPYAGAIAKGKANAPLKFRSEYNTYVRGQVFQDARPEFVADLANTLSHLSQADLDAIAAVYDGVAANGAAQGDNPDNDLQTFHMQLGEYNVRQCL